MSLIQNWGQGCHIKLARVKLGSWKDRQLWSQNVNLHPTYSHTSWVTLSISPNFSSFFSLSFSNLKMGLMIPTRCVL